MSDRTDALYRLAHPASAFRGQADTIVVEVEEAVLIVQDAEAERDRLRAEKEHLRIVNAALRTRPDLADRAPMVVELADENERLRALVEDDEAIIAAASAANRDRAREIDRLRAVVEAAKAVQHDPQCARLEHRAGCTCGWRTLRYKLDQLDISGNMSAPRPDEDGKP